MSDLNYFVLNPKDPLIIRSSRPFEAISDAEAAKFPPPSTIAGALRNLHGRTIGIDFNNKEKLKTLLELQVSGPLAIKIPTDKSVDEIKLTEQDILVPKPADAQYFAQGENKVVVGMQPAQPNDDDEGCDLPNDLLPLFLSQDIQGKPVGGPKWWSINDLLEWRRGEQLDFSGLEARGWTPTEPDIRTHIERDNTTRTSVDGQIFQTTGLTMWQQPNEHDVFPSERVGILAGIHGEISLTAMNLGGERRLAEVSPCDVWPQSPRDLARDIIKAGGLTLTFLTPTIFKAGWRPAWLDKETLTGTPPGCKTLQLTLKAAALERWQPQSGWDLASNKPRASERMIPAGATYWFEIVDGPATEQEIETLWMAHLCDNEQHNLNGFGLTLPMAYAWNEQ